MKTTQTYRYWNDHSEVTLIEIEKAVDDSALKIKGELPSDWATSPTRLALIKSTIESIIQPPPKWPALLALSVVVVISIGLVYFSLMQV